MLRNSSAEKMPHSSNPSAMFALLPNGKSVPNTICEVETSFFKAAIWMGLLDPAVSFGHSPARPLSIKLMIVRAVSVLYSMVVSEMPGIRPWQQSGTWACV